MGQKLSKRIEFWEEKIETHQQQQDGKQHVKSPYCDACLYTLDENYRKGIYLCMFCEKYLCGRCFKGHEDHNVLMLNSEEEANKKALETFVETMVHEGKNKEELIQQEDIYVCDRVEMKHPLDNTSPSITGLCGLGRRRWVACDNNNNCIKVYEIGTNTLIKYIRFRSQVWDVTEVIHPEYQNTNTATLEERWTCASKTCQTSSNEKCALFVSLPKEKVIMILGIDDNPVRKFAHITITEQCYDINSHGDHLFIKCLSTICITTINGEVLKRINSRQVHVPFSFFLYYDADGLKRIKFGGDLLSSQKLLTESIFVKGYNYENLFVSVENYGSIFKFDKNSFNVKSLLSNFPWRSIIAQYREKLYVSRLDSRSNKTMVIVIQIT